MCTAIAYTPADHYFGRNLDLERSYGERITVTPRNYPFHFRNGTTIQNHYAMVGMAAVVDDYPLYFEATNEKGLSLAGLNFPDNAIYLPFAEGKDNISPFELIPWLLGQCDGIDSARRKLESMNLWAEPFSEKLPLSPLHWLLSDKKQSLTIECTIDGMKIYDNPVGVLTNNPPYPYHLHNLTNYMQLTDAPPVNRQSIPLKPYSLGLGSFGLPGDMSSGSRFVKAAFTKLHSQCDSTEESAVNQFFHILGSVCQQRGLTQLPNGEYEYTLYSSCCNAGKGIYYYKTYENFTIHAVDMHRENLSGTKLICYPMAQDGTIQYQN